MYKSLLDRMAEKEFWDVLSYSIFLMTICSWGSGESIFIKWLLLAIKLDDSKLVCCSTNRWDTQKLWCYLFLLLNVCNWEKVIKAVAQPVCDQLQKLSLNHQHDAQSLSTCITKYTKHHDWAVDMLLHSNSSSSIMILCSWEHTPTEHCMCNWSSATACCSVEPG